ncbi:MAG TPA: chorismate synthase [Gaiellaceae bacterium]
MTLDLVTAGESHGPALVAIVSGLPAGLALDRAAIDSDLRRRQQGYGRSPRQSIETDEVQVLAGLRQGRTLGTPLALVVENRDHGNWTWGMSPWPPQGEPQGKGTKAVTLPRPGHADLAGVQKYGHADVRDALERASARHTAVFVAAGSVAKQLLASIGIEVRGEAVPADGADPAATTTAVCRADARSSASRTSAWPYFWTPARSAWPGRGSVTGFVPFPCGPPSGGHGFIPHVQFLWSRFSTTSASGVPSVRPCRSPASTCTSSVSIDWRGERP